MSGVSRARQVTHFRTETAVHAISKRNVVEPELEERVCLLSLGVNRKSGWEQEQERRDQAEQEEKV